MRYTKHSIHDETGFKISVTGPFLDVEDLNPEVCIRFRVSNWELFLIGFWFIRRSLRRI